MEDAPGPQPLDLQASAREWHRLQLGALAFVGLCGVVKGDAGNADPVWLQTTSGLLALAGLVIAVVSVLMVASVAWPLGPTSDDPVERRQTRRRERARLKQGIGLTFVAVAVTALAASSSWWPTEEGDTVRVSTEAGSLCGTVVATTEGWVTLEVDGEEVRTPLGDVRSIAPADGC